MDFAKAQYERIRQQLDGLSASQRMLTVTLLVIMGITLMYWVRYAGKPEMEALLDQTIAAEDVARIREKLSQRGIAYQVTGDRVLVPADKKDEALAGLLYDQALPSNTSATWEAIVAKLSPFSSEGQNDKWWMQALQAKQAEIIGSWPGVAVANVMIDMTAHRGFGDNNVKPSATVSIKLLPGRRMDKKLVMAAADMVAGSRSGLDRGRVKVIVNGVSYPVADDGADSIGGSGDLMELRQQNEKYFTDKIAQQLGWLNAQVFASVSVDINTKATQEESTTYDPKGTAKVETKIRSKTNDQSTDSKGSAEPGVGANTQGSLAEGGGGGARQSQTEGEDETEFQAGLSKKLTNTREGPGRATVLGATVRVPRSYFVRVFKRGDASMKDPDDAALQPLLDRELMAIRGDVRKCTGLTDDKAVEVATYDDAILGPAEATIAVTPPSGVQMMVGGHGKEIALGALAVVSLLMMTSMVRKGTPAVVVASTPDMPVQVPQLGGTEEVVGEAGDGETILGGMELDEDAAKTQQMLGQVSNLVKENPDAAANLIKRWMNK